MYTTSLKVSDYVNRFYTVHINASWISIYNDMQTKECLFDRNPQNNNWYDEKHKAIVDAMRELEKAIFEAVDSTK